MYPPAQPVKKSSHILGKIATVIKWFFIIIGVLFTIFVLIGIFVFEPERRAEEAATATQEAAAARIILVPTYTPTPGEPTPTAVPPTATPAPPTATRIPAPTPRPTTPAFLARCLDVPAGKIDAIETGLTVGPGGYLDDKTAQAVRSADFSKAYFIAAVILGPGMGTNSQIGIWASNDLDPNNGLIFAIDAMSAAFSDWGRGSTTDYEITQFDDGGQEALKCVQYKQANP